MSLKPDRFEKSEAQRQHEELLAATIREIDAIAEQYHKRLPRAMAKAVAAIYARYSTRLQGSIVDQVRSLYEAALRDGIFIPRELVFFDMAIRGYRDHRPGLDQLRQALSAKSFNILLVFGTNRLYRKAYKAMRFVEEEVVERGIRCIFPQQAIDTNNPNWKLHFQLHAAIDENGTSMYAENIRAAHQGLFLRGMIVTTIPTGYAAEPVPGELTRRGRPRCKLILSEREAPYIRLIFEWYVKERLTIDAIVQRLNDDPLAPRPPKAVHGRWTHFSVKRVLTNPTYRGCLVYGATETKYKSSKDYIYQVSRDEPLQTRQVEELRIVSDELWFEAQVLLAKEPGRRGRKAKHKDRVARPKLLNGLFRCAEHQQPLHVGGGGGSLMLCPHCRELPRSKRPLFSWLNRKVALELTCRKLAELLQAHDRLVDDLFAACQLEAETLQKPDPAELTRLKAQDRKLRASIEMAIRNSGDAGLDEADFKQLLLDMRNERKKVCDQIKLLEIAGTRAARFPSKDDIRGMLESLSAILVSAAESDDETQQRLARRIIEEMTGGAIDVFQMGERKVHHGWLQGRFRVRLFAFLIEKATDIPPAMIDDSIEVFVDYKRPTSFADEAEQAWRLYSDEHKTKRAIQALLGFSRSKVDRLIAFAARKHGKDLEDGRARSGKIKREGSQPRFQLIADEVYRLKHDEHLLLQDIAKRLGVNRNMVTKAYQWWHESRGLPIPDGRSERRPPGADRSAA